MHARMEVSAASALLSGVGLPQYSELFEAHHITPQILGSLNEVDLEAMGIASVGHRKRVMGALRTQYFAGDGYRRAPQASRAASASRCRCCVDVLLSFFSAVVTGRFLDGGRMSWRDVIDMNTQLSTVSALVWFASITFITGLASVASFPFGDSQGPGGMEEWIFRTTYFFFALSCVTSALSTLLSICNNMIMYQVSESDFATFMRRSGNLALRISFGMFVGGVLALVLGFDFMIYGTMGSVDRWVILSMGSGLLVVYSALLTFQVFTLSQMAQDNASTATCLDGVHICSTDQVTRAAVQS
jgi:hypothetical protein